MYRTAGKLKYLSSNLFPENIVHGFMTREGGVSAPPFDSLNFDNRDTDPEENIAENRRRLGEAFSMAPDVIFLVNQVHGKEVFLVDGGPAAKKPDADAVITDREGTGLGILTADCQPVLLYDKKNGAIAAVHAGWKGTASMVVPAALEAMKQRFGTAPFNVVAALGPHIGPCCYQVGENVAEEFRSAFNDTGGFLYKNTYDNGNDNDNHGQWRLDIGKANYAQLIAAGVPAGSIESLSPCTACNAGLFFSYRRDGGRTGRLLSFIMIRTTRVK